MGIPFGTLSRVPKIVVEYILRRLNLLAPNLTKPEHVAYDSTWARTFLATAIAILYCPLCPAVIPCALFHMGVSYLTLARSFLFTFSRGWIVGKVDGGKGLMWAVASKWLLIFLAGGQLLLMAMHLAQEQVASLGAIVPLLLLTRYKHLHFVREHAPLLRLVAQRRIVQEEASELDVEEGPVAGSPTSSLLQVGIEHRDGIQACDRDTYTQPELTSATWLRLREGQPPPKKPGERSRSLPINLTRNQVVRRAALVVNNVINRVTQKPGGCPSK